MADYRGKIEYLQSVARNPKKQLDQYLSEGKKVVGCFPVHTPEVLVHAAGMIPMGLWGAQTEYSLVKSYLPPFACPIMQSCLELGLNGTYNGISAVIIPALCDTFRSVCQDWKMGIKKIPLIPITYPQNRQFEASVGFLIEELKFVSRQLENICEVEISEYDIKKSIAVYNAHMEVMNEFAKVANEHLDLITPIVRHAVMKSATFMEKAEHTLIMKEIIAGLKEEPVYKWEGKKILLTGITGEPDSLLQIFADQNMAVVGDDLAQESRQYRTQIPDHADPYEALARQWQNRYGDSMAYSPKYERSVLLADMAKKTGASGVILCLMKFCDQEEYEEPGLKAQLKEEGLPMLTIDIDQQPTGNDQARTRIQTFAELI